MAEALGRVLRDVQAMLDRHEVKLGAPYRELGADPYNDAVFLAELSDSCRSLPPLDGAARRAFDGPRLNAYSAAKGTLGQLHDYVADVVAQGRGSEDNTRQALALLANAQAALKRLMALLGGGAEADEAARPAAADRSQPPPPTAADKPAPPPPPSPPAALTPQAVAEKLEEGFSKAEMKDLAFKLKFVVDDLPENGTLFEMARSLVVYADRRSKLAALVAQAERERPGLFL